MSREAKIVAGAGIAVVLLVLLVAGVALAQGLTRTASVPFRSPDGFGWGPGVMTGGWGPGVMMEPGMMGGWGLGTRAYPGAGGWRYPGTGIPPVAAMRFMPCAPVR